MGLATPNANWPLELRTFFTKGNIVSAHYQKILSPTMVNEFVVGLNWRYEAENHAGRPGSNSHHDRPWASMRRNSIRRPTR